MHWHTLQYLIMIFNKCQRILIKQIRFPVCPQSRYLFADTPNNPNQNKKEDGKEKKQYDVNSRMKIGFKHPLQDVIHKKFASKIKDLRLRHELHKLQNASQMGVEGTRKQFLEMIKKFNGEEFKKKQKSEENKDEKQEDKEQEKKKSQMSEKNSKVAKWIIILVLLFLFSDTSNNSESSEKGSAMHMQSFIEEVKKTNQKVIVRVSRKQNHQIYVQSQIGQKRIVFNVTDNQLITLLERLETIKDGTTEVIFPPSQHSSFSIDQRAFSYLFFILMSWLIFRFIKARRASGQSSSMNPMSLLQTKKFKAVSPESINIKFKDVAGMHEAKFEITQFVDFLKKPEKYIEMGAKVPKGALLTGPPGTGKTLLAKACSGEAGVPFFSVSGSDFVEKYVGLGASRVRSLFEQAQKVAPSIIFIDQIDAIGKKRDSGPFSNQERDNTLNQLLVKMDGFDTKNKVIVMAATNRKDMLDPALLRPGRFDRSVEIGLPNLEERAEILKVHLKKVKYDKNLTEDDLSKKIARITPGFSGAELANTCNQAAILAARQKLDGITLQNFQKATERVMAGLQKRNMFNQEEKQMLAFYEAGKAVGNWFTEGADPVIKISILPFSKSKTGYSHNIQNQTSLHTKQQLFAKVSCYLAGRTAEQYFKGYVTTNGNKDLERAKRIITMIVTKFGMSDAIKMYAYPDFEYVKKPYSEKTEALIDEEISRIMELCVKRIQEVIKSKEQLILKLKQRLLEKQTLSHNQIKQILGDRPFKGGDNYTEYLKDQQQQDSFKGPTGPGAGAATS